MKTTKYYIICFLILIFLISGCVKETEEEKVVEKIEDKEVSGEIPEFVSHIVVSLTEEKTMVPSSLQINKGDVIKWINEDENFNHNLIIYPADIERPKASDVIIQSGNIVPGDSWDYTFEEVGSYTVKDIFSGTMRGEITAEVTAEISEGKDIGTVIVE